MKLGNFHKTPAERKRYGIDYSDWLDTGEGVATWQFDVSPATPTPLVIDGVTLDSVSSTLTFYASGGMHGKVYTVTVTTTTSQSQIKEDDVLFSVRNS